MTDETTGTTSADDGDAAAETPTTGTPSDAGRDAAGGEPDYKQLYLASKTKLEQANRMEAELAEARRQREAPNDDVDDGTAADPDEDLSPEDWARVADFARRGDPVARAQIANRKMNIALAKNVRDSFQLRDIEDREERKATLEHFARNRHRLGDIGAARAEVREKKLESENVELRKKLELATKQPPKDVVKTHSREVSAAESKAREMSTKDFDADQASLRAAGDHAEARKRQLDLMNDRIVLKD